jgi:CheY-like chemotaxis protein
MLPRFGYTLLTAETGEEALEIYERERDHIDLVILDLIMPGMGGRRCLEELKKLNPDLKVILASGFTEDVDPHQVGASNFLRKPYRLQQLLEAVRQVLSPPPS